MFFASTIIFIGLMSLLTIFKKTENPDKGNEDIIVNTKLDGWEKCEIVYRQLEYVLSVVLAQGNYLLKGLFYFNS